MKVKVKRTRSLQRILNQRKAKKRGKTQTSLHHGDTGITSVVTGWLTGGKMSSLSQPYYTVEFIYSIVPHTYTICGRIYMQINYLPVGGAVGVNKLTARKVYLFIYF